MAADLTPMTAEAVGGSGLILVAAAPPPPAAPVWKVVDPGDHSLGLEDPGGWYSADVRSDGCVHLRRYFNEPKHAPGRDPDDHDYWHLCDLDAEIARLQALKAAAAAHFGPGWPS